MLGRGPRRRSTIYGREMGYIFDPDVLHDVAGRAVGKPIEAMVDLITTELTRRYPGHILDERQWVFNNAGGAMGSMMLLHASLTEYIIVFGTAIGTEGASGRFPADDWFFVLEGEHWSYGEGDLHRTVTRPGQVATLRRGEAKAYRLPDRAWGLEYARGAIPLMFPFGFADTFTSTLDFRTFTRTMRLYSKAVMTSTATRIADTHLGELLPALFRRAPHQAAAATAPSEKVSSSNEKRPSGSSPNGSSPNGGRPAAFDVTERG